MTSRHRLTSLVSAAAVAIAAAAALAVPTPNAHAATPLSQNPSNPLAVPDAWHYSAITTAANPELTDYLAASNASTKAAMAKIAFAPRVRWFGNCASCNVATTKEQVASYVEDQQRGDPNALVQLAIFGLWPQGEVVNGKRPAISWTMTRYENWIKQIAAGIGDARVAIILEPDLAITANHKNGGSELNDPTPAKRQQYAAWAAKYLAQTLKHEAIYIDAGSADWLYVSEAVNELEHSGIRYARGFALGATHYDSVSSNVSYAAQVAQGLAKDGYGSKHAVIDTSDNGTPFTWLQWNARYGAKFRATGNQYYQFDNTPTCGSTTQQVCETLGHRPTWNPLGGEASKLGLGPSHPQLREEAARYIDGYLWFGRGWRWMQMGGNDAQTKTRMVRMGTYTRFTEAAVPAVLPPQLGG